jgi:phosphoribosylformylglycinamidine synthase
MKPKALIVRAPGTNCDEETKYAFDLAGADAEVFHINRLLENPEIGKQFQILCIPGGFSYGDDIAAGRIFANQFRLYLKDLIYDFKTNNKLVLGICNGFQVLIKSGALFESEEQEATLTWNESGKYDDRWVDLETANENCVFLKGSDRLYLPVAHAEGKFVPQNDATLANLENAGQLPLRYAAGIPAGLPNETHSENASDASAISAQLSFPCNPNGSTANVAGLCDPSGRLFGLMPHPERFIDRTQHPHWTRKRDLKVGDGLAIFTNAVDYLKS